METTDSVNDKVICREQADGDDDDDDGVTYLHYMNAREPINFWIFVIVFILIYYT